VDHLATRQREIASRIAAMHERADKTGGEERLPRVR
jgi:hypothetical protein